MTVTAVAALLNKDPAFRLFFDEKRNDVVALKAINSQVKLEAEATDHKRYTMILSMPRRLTRC